jgi:FAD synthetase
LRRLKKQLQIENYQLKLDILKFVFILMRVMVFGTFDNLHPGHENYFLQASRFGALLIVIVARDKNVLQIKGRLPRQTEMDRVKGARAALKKLNIPGRAVLGGLKNRWQVLKKYQPKVIALGYDQQVDLKKLKSELSQARLFCKIKRLKAYQPERYKSSYCLDKTK